MNANVFAGICMVIMFTMFSMGAALENTVSDSESISLTIDPAISAKIESFMVEWLLQGTI